MTDATGTSAAIRCPNCGELLKYEGEHWEQGGYFCRAIPNRVISDTGPQSELEPEGRTVIWDTPATPNRVTIELERDKARYLAKLLRERCGDSDEERYLRRLIGEALS